MKKFIIQFVLLIIVIFGALYFATTRQPGLLKPAERSISTQILVGTISVNVEKADTPEKRSKGLGERQSLASDSGMLFIFPQEDIYKFWMKGLKFPLDFIWIKQGFVVDIIKNAQPPQPNQSDETLPLYVPNQPVDMVLEVNAGFVDQHGIKIGDKVEIK